MPAKKIVRTPLEEFWPARLTIPKDIFQAKLEERIKIWEELLNKQINNEQDYEDINNEHKKRDSRNKEFFAQSFNYPNNQYFDEYAYWRSFSMSMREPYLGEKIENLQDDIKYDIEKLKIILNKADLIPVSLESIHKEQLNEKPLHLIKNILKGFHKCAQELRFRHQGRETIIINDEYDVQDLLRSILKVHFSDVRAEDYSPSSAGWNSRIDLVLTEENIIIETKITSERLKDKEAWEQIAIDIVRYQWHPSFNTLVVFIYDKWDNIRNKRWLIQDLERQSKPRKEIVVIINPE